MRQKENDKSRDPELNWKGRKNTERSKNVDKYTVDFPPLLGFSKLCWTSETKIVRLIWFLMYVKEIFKIIVLQTFRGLRMVQH